MFEKDKELKQKMEKNLDFRIWQKFKKGDEKAFSYIFDTYSSQLYEYGKRFTLDHENIKDSIQDVFFELASRRFYISETDNILFYLLKSLRHKIFQNLKKKKYVQSSIENFDKENFILEYSTEVSEEEKEFKLNLVAKAINDLSPRQKEIIYLKFYKNLSNKEVAQITKIKAQSVSNSIQKSILKLKKILNSSPKTTIFLFRVYCKINKTESTDCIL